MVRISTVMAIIGGAAILVGSSLTVRHFDPTDPWFGVGLVLAGVGCVAGLMIPTLLMAVRIDDAYRYGWDAGYAKGRRSATLKVVPMQHEPVAEVSRLRSRQKG